MFRRFPFFQRLLSWTKPHAQLPHASKAYERYDWNSLVAFEPEHRAVMPELMDGTSEFPARGRRWRRASGSSRSGPACRCAYQTPWQGTSRDGRALRPPHARRGLPQPRRHLRGGHRRAAPARDAGHRARAHYADTRDAASYADQVGSSSSASRTRASSSPAACSSGPAPSSWPRRGRRSCRSTCTRWGASGRATCSPGRTPTWAAASSSSMPRSSASSGMPAALPCTPDGPTTGSPSWSRSTRSSPRPASARRSSTSRTSG